MERTPVAHNTCALAASFGRQLGKVKANTAVSTVHACDGYGGHSHQHRCKVVRIQGAPRGSSRMAKDLGSEI
jgi:hypothetical protein